MEWIAAAKKDAPQAASAAPPAGGIRGNVNAGWQAHFKQREATILGRQDRGQLEDREGTVVGRATSAQPAYYGPLITNLRSKCKCEARFPGSVLNEITQV